MKPLQELETGQTLLLDKKVEGVVEDKAKLALVPPPPSEEEIKEGRNKIGEAMIQPVIANTDDIEDICCTLEKMTENRKRAWDTPIVIEHPDGKYSLVGGSKEKRHEFKERYNIF